MTELRPTDLRPNAPDRAAPTRAARAARFVADFRDHPASAGETYLQHLRFAGGFGGALIVAGLAAWVHALVPPLCGTTASRAVRRLHDRVTGRH